MSAIADLIEELDGVAFRPIAKGKGEAKLWLSDFEAYTRARMGNVGPLPDSLRPLVDRALSDWRERENHFLGSLTRDEFLQKTEKAIQEYAPDTDPEFEILMLGERNARLLTVHNIDWVHGFAWILPLADPENVSTYRSIGEVMATIMGCEALVKSKDMVANYRFLRSVAAESAKRS